jgi:eukaryotic-like serine/threonine-protein kinase
VVRRAVKLHARLAACRCLLEHSSSWADAKRIFSDALDLPPDERDAFLASACGNSEALLGEVRSLLAWHDQSTGFLEEPAGHLSTLALTPTAPRDLVGTTVGVWRVESLVGSGGMGVVYRAERADAAFRRQVALKVIRPGSDSDAIVRRFQAERETLAALDHPNIARLLDGGTTPDGQPFFAMEFIEGVPIDRYCDEHRLPIARRLQLFRAVCAGVRYAHANLVVHRDIKPDNILVTRDGTPKLLDFGVAKLVAAGVAPADEAAGAATWLMTPDYASPEQLGGRASTIATDIYSLGVLLYVLLAGERPYRLKSVTPDEIERELLHLPLVPPSAMALRGPHAEAAAEARATTPEKLSQRLDGDLDAIVRRAMSREPTARYSSVEQIAQDLEHHRRRYPIAARERRASYVAGRFVQRHLTGIAVAALLVMSVAGGAVAALWQAAQATEARGRAERRFADVRALAGSFMFEVYDALDTVPGTTPARELIVQKAVEYLESLAAESGDDLGLQQELAGAFVRVGDVQGNPTAANVGDASGALKSYGRAVVITESLRGARPADHEAARVLALARRRRADVLALTGAKAEALVDLEKSSQIYLELAARSDATVDDRLEAGIAHVKLGDLLGNPNFENLGRAAEADGEYDLALAAFERLQPEAPNDWRVRRFIGLTLERLGTLREHAGELQAAQQSYESSYDVRRQLAAAHTSHRDIVRDLGVALEKLGNLRRAQSGPAAAVPTYRESLAVFERLARIDPSDANAMRTVAISKEKLGLTLRHGGSRSESLTLLGAALATHRDLVAMDPANVRASCDLARVAETVGDLRAELQAPASAALACALWRESDGARHAHEGRCSQDDAVATALAGKLRSCGS